MPSYMLKNIGMGKLQTANKNIYPIKPKEKPIKRCVIEGCNKEIRMGKYCIDHKVL